VWLYAASKALASEDDTFFLARDSGFLWRSFYNSTGVPIACVKSGPTRGTNWSWDIVAVELLSCLRDFVSAGRLANRSITGVWQDS
jgi:hypothetical protein